ncbi:hypothetical protein BH23GEM3_BH23GEM3_03100 [soil metagenome]
MKLFYVRLALLLVATSILMGAPRALQAQQPARNSAYLELLGNGGLYSLNYERLLGPALGGRLGIMTFQGEGEEGDRVRIVLAPVMANYLAGSGPHRLEAGAGPVIAYATGTIREEDIGEFSGFGVAATGTLGYRYHPPAGGFIFRAGLTPLLSSAGLTPSVGLSIGYAF